MKFYSIVVLLFFAATIPFNINPNPASFSTQALRGLQEMTSSPRNFHRLVPCRNLRYIQRSSLHVNRPQRVPLRRRKRSAKGQDYGLILPGEVKLQCRFMRNRNRRKSDSPLEEDSRRKFAYAGDNGLSYWIDLADVSQLPNSSDKPLTNPVNIPKQSGDVSTTRLAGRFEVSEVFKHDREVYKDGMCHQNNSNHEVLGRFQVKDLAKSATPNSPTGILEVSAVLTVQKQTLDSCSSNPKNINLIQLEDSNEVKTSQASDNADSEVIGRFVISNLSPLPICSRDSSQERRNIEILSPQMIDDFIESGSEEFLISPSLIKNSHRFSNSRLDSSPSIESALDKASIQQLMFALINKVNGMSDQILDLKNENKSLQEEIASLRQSQKGSNL